MASLQQAILSNPVLVRALADRKQDVRMERLRRKEALNSAFNARQIRLIRNVETNDDPDIDSLDGYISLLVKKGAPQCTIAEVLGLWSPGHWNTYWSKLQVKNSWLAEYD